MRNLVHFHHCPNAYVLFPYIYFLEKLFSLIIGNGFLPRRFPRLAITLAEYLRNRIPSNSF